MAVLPKTEIPQEISQGALIESTPQAAPDLSKYSKDELASMLRADQEGAPTKEVPAGTPQEEIPQAPPEIKQPEQPKPEEAPQVPDKFKNPDGSVNIDNLVKSYIESQSTMHRQMNALQDVELLKSENTELKQYLKELQEFKTNLESRIAQAEQATAEQTPTPEEWAGMSPQEQQAYIDKKVETKVQQLQIKQQAEREMDAKITASIESVSKLPGYEQIKNDINELLKSNVIDYHPDAPKIAYYAALGRKTGDIVAQAKNMGYSEGYAKAKSEMGKVVDGGKSTEPISIENISPDRLNKMSRQELEKLLPRYHNDV